MYKDGKPINLVTFQRARNAANLNFRPWQVIHSVPGQTLPFYWHDSLEKIKSALEQGGYTWEWSPIENILSE